MKIFLTCAKRPKNYPFIHKPYTLCVLCVLRGEFLQWTHKLYGRNIIAEIYIKAYQKALELGLKPGKDVVFIYRENSVIRTFRQACG